MKKMIRRMLILLFAGIFLFSAWQLWGILRSYQEGQSAYRALEQHVSFVSPEGPSEQPASEKTPDEKETESQEEPDLSAWPVVDFGALAGINPEIVGWIYIEGTDIHYPVVQGKDNDYYLNHLFDGTYHTSGCIFLDYRCEADFSDRHSIVYGHHMNDQSMFADLMKYKDQGFYEEHSVARLVTPGAYYTLRFFSGYVSDNWSNAWDLDLDESNYGIWLREVQEKSCFEAACVPAPEDRIVTLSTCSYEFSDAKFVLHGYICEEIEQAGLE